MLGEPDIRAWQGRWFLGLAPISAVPKDYAPFGRAPRHGFRKGFRLFWGAPWPADPRPSIGPAPVPRFGRLFPRSSWWPFWRHAPAAHVQPSGERAAWATGMCIGSAGAPAATRRTP